MTDPTCLFILSLIRSCLCIGRLSFVWKEFSKALFVFQVPEPAGAIFERKSNKMTNTMIGHIYLYKESEEEQVRGEFTEEKNSS